MDLLLNSSENRFNKADCDTLQELEAWFAVSGDADDFIYYDTEEKSCSQK